jgi:hypothetical protein
VCSLAGTYIGGIERGKGNVSLVSLVTIEKIVKTLKV